MSRLFNKKKKEHPQRLTVFYYCQVYNWKLLTMNNSYNYSFLFIDLFKLFIKREKSVYKCFCFFFQPLWKKENNKTCVGYKIISGAVSRCDFLYTLFQQTKKKNVCSIIFLSFLWHVHLSIIFIEYFESGVQLE